MTTFAIGRIHDNIYIRFNESSSYGLTEPEALSLIHQLGIALGRRVTTEGVRPESEITRLQAEVSDLKRNVIAFGGPWACQCARSMGLPDGHLHPIHYDILKRAGARMADFTRAELPDYPPSQAADEKPAASKPTTAFEVLLQAAHRLPTCHAYLDQCPGRDVCVKAGSCLDALADRPGRVSGGAG